MNKELKYAFIIHLSKYLGIALVSGSIVHAGTLGGNTYKYIGLIVVGICLTVLGNYLEYKVKNIKIGMNIFLLAILLSFGTGMLSGGVQHYSDNPAYGSVLLSFGLILTFISLAYKDFSNVISKKSIYLISVISIILYFLLSIIGNSPLFLKSSDNVNDSLETSHHK